MTTSLFKAILFDLDGTLIDTEHADFAAAKLLAQEVNAEISLDFWAANIVGITGGYNIFFELLQQQSHQPHLTSDFLWQRLQQLWEQTMENLALMPGAASLLSGLQGNGYRLGLVSASDQAWVDRWLDHFDLRPYFQNVTTGDDVQHNKPAPDIYQLAATRLQVRPDQCLVFEDSIAGIQAAKAAGMTVVAVPNSITRNLNFSHADQIVFGLDQVNVKRFDTMFSPP